MSEESEERKWAAVLDMAYYPEVYTFETREAAEECVQELTEHVGKSAAVYLMRIEDRS